MQLQLGERGAYTWPSFAGGKIFVRNLETISGVGIIGMSQGGWIAPIVARDSDDLGFVVSMVGSTVTPNEQLLFEEDHNLRQMGFLPGVSYAIALMSTRYIIMEGDKTGGSGANFIVKWKATQKVNPPIIEGVMIGTHSGQGISFVSRGQIIKDE